MVTGDPEAWFEFVHAVEPVLDVAAGQRNRAVDAGFTPEAASAIGADIHHFIITMMIHNLTRKATP